MALSICVSAPAVSWAQDSSTTLDVPSLTTLSAESPQGMKHSTKGEVKFESSKYGTSIPGFENLDLAQLLTVDLQLSGQKVSEDFASVKHNRYNFDFSAGKYLDWGNAFFSVQEVYYQKSSPVSSWTIGRKIEFWSQVDSDWNLGLWEPKFNIDLLRPKNQGLTGIFYNTTADDIEVLAYVTPIFIPTMGPEIREQDGTLVSDSRWYRAPSTSQSLLGKNVEAVYSLDMPNVGRLIANPGGGVRLRWGGKQAGWWSSMSAGYKPINSLPLKYDKKLWVTSTLNGQAVVSPEVGYHTIAGFDLGYISESGSRVSASALADRPQRQLPQNNSEDTDWVQQQPGQLSALALHIDTNMHVIGLDPWGFYIDYLKVFEELTVDYDSSGLDQGSLFPYRTNYTNAVSFKVANTGNLFGKKFMTTFKYLREFDQAGTVVGFEGVLYPVRSWAVNFGFDILGTDDSSNENPDGRFLNQFRANDRVFGGLSYVF